MAERSPPRAAGRPISPIKARAFLGAKRESSSWARCGRARGGRPAGEETREGIGENPAARILPCFRAGRPAPVRARAAARVTSPRTPDPPGVQSVSDPRRYGYPLLHSSSSMLRARASRPAEPELT